MDKDGLNEVTNRLRSAIKKKLVEISEFVDDELPEYIMILVANQRSKSQIEKDLSLFLRDDTASFTNWLWNLLNSINTGSKNTTSSKFKSDDNVSKKKESDLDEDAVVLDYYADEHENELLCHEDTNDGVSNKTLAFQRSTESERIKKVIKSVENLTHNISASVCKEKPSEKVYEKKEQRKLSETKKNKSQTKKGSKECVSSKIVSVKRRYANSDDEYDPSKPELIKPSVPRNYSGTAAFQANKLLLKAVDDAAKSILDGQNVEDFYKPTPIKVLTSRQFSRSSRETDDEDEDSSYFAENSDFLPSVPKIVSNKSHTSNKGRTICMANTSPETDSPDFKNSCRESDTTAENPKSPHFIVTMEGINLNSFKRKLEDSVDSIEDEEMEVDDFAEDISPSKKLKVAERCKYWPACKNSDNCLYHHPTTPCKCFPDCKFGDKCLYIHPNCKFDALCSRKDCPFTHASKRKLPLKTIPVKMMPVKPRRPQIMCKYYPKCTVRSCLFIHPKMCRYGTECRSPGCSFGHLPVPPRSQLKWQAPDL